jgi:hypothetical protein
MLASEPTIRRKELVRMIVRFGPGRRTGSRTACRELDSRDSHGFRIRLLWRELCDEVLVHVSGADGTDFWLCPPKALARYAFEHPFALVKVYPVAVDGARLAA